MNGIIWTSLHACFTADASAGIEIHDTVVTNDQDADRANGHTGSVGAVIAPHDAEGSVRVGETTLLDVLDPGAVHPDRGIVLGLTGDRAGVAADTLTVVDDERVVHGVYEGRILSYRPEKADALLRGVGA